MDTAGDLVNSCFDNCQKVISKLSGFSQAVSNHIVCGYIPKLGDGFVINNGLFDADDVSKEPLVLAGFQVVNTAEEILVVSDGQSRYFVSFGPEHLLKDLPDKEHVPCKFLKTQGFSC